MCFVTITDHKLKEQKIMEEKPKYGWYVRNLALGFSFIGILGVLALIVGIFILGFIGIVLIIVGVVVTFVCLWPGIGMIVLNLTIGDSIYLVKKMEALNMLKNPEVLDVGCGTGRTAIKIAKNLKNGGHLTGIDVYSKLAISGNALETVRNNAKLESVEEKTTFQYGSATEIPFENERFDIVNFSSVLHELHEHGGLDKALKETLRVLKPGGYLYVSEWNRCSWQLILYTGIFCFVFKNRKFWNDLLINYGFDIEDIDNRGGFNIFTTRKPNKVV